MSASVSWPSSTLFTERLVLELQRPDHIEDLIHVVDESPLLKEFVSWANEPVILDEWMRHAYEEVEKQIDGTGFVYVTLLDGRVVGTVDFRLNDDGNWEFGYWVRDDHRGLGIAAEGCQVMLEEVFRNDLVQVVEAHTDSANESSKALLTRLGLTYSGRSMSSTSLGTRSTGFDEIWSLTRAALVRNTSAVPAVTLGRPIQAARHRSKK